MVKFRNSRGSGGVRRAGARSVAWFALMVAAFVTLSGITQCNTNCPVVDANGNPVLGEDGEQLREPCISCSVTPEPQCKGRSWNQAAGSQCNAALQPNLPDGTACDSSGTPGLCESGECVVDASNECAGDEFFSVCASPAVGVPTGACLDNRCVLAAPDDECMKENIGRINCCTEEGCAAASGAYCTKPMEDDTPCDPSGIEAPGQTGQDGLCKDGTCVAQTGACAGLVCETTQEDPCGREFCDPDVGACREYQVLVEVGCATSLEEAYCQAGVCTADFIRVCDDADTCTTDIGVNGDCFYQYNGDGPTCTRDGFPGVCAFNRCQPVFQPCVGQPESFCDDGNPCTTDTCERSLNTCRNTTKVDGTVCGGASDVCLDGNCITDLCSEANCDDGDSCTIDTCSSPFGLCFSERAPAGTPCEGNGQCDFLGNCQPVVVACSSASECTDGRSCTRDVCNGPLGCSNPTVPNGQPCIGEPGQCFLGSCQPVINP